MVTDTNGQTVGMIGFPYFLLVSWHCRCKRSRRWWRPRRPRRWPRSGGPGNGAILYSIAPEVNYLTERYEAEEVIVHAGLTAILALIGAGIKRRLK